MCKKKTRGTKGGHLKIYKGQKVDKLLKTVQLFKGLIHL